MSRKIAVILITLLFLVIPTFAQNIQPSPEAVINPNFNISWPPPVYVLSEEVDIIGSANLAGMTGYFIEYRPLVTEKAMDGTETPWFPVSLLFNTPVLNGVLSSWNTRTVEDGLYELRLVLNLESQPASMFVVSPLRIQNDPPFIVESMNTTPTATPFTRPARPTLMPTPTGMNTTPLVTAVLDANVRAGDGLSYSRVGYLMAGESALVLGRSNRGNGWYFIRMNDGTEGWIAPSTVTASGDFSDVGVIEPPATSTPLPTLTPVPSGNLAASAPVVTGIPTCQVDFEVRMNVTNNGTSATDAPVIVTFQDVRTATGAVQQTRDTVLPIMQAGANYVVTATFNISTYYGENHTIYVTIDSQNAVTESNEDDNVYSVTYQLQRGGC